MKIVTVHDFPSRHSMEYMVMAIGRLRTDAAEENLSDHEVGDTGTEKYHWMTNAELINHIFDIHEGDAAEICRGFDIDPEATTI